MRDTILNIRNQITNGNFEYSNKNQLGFSIISPLLSELGWIVTNPQEVRIDYTEGGIRADFALFSNIEWDIMIKTIPSNERIQSYTTQPFTNSFNNTKVKISILTNGVIYWFYLPHLTNLSWEEKKFFSLDIYNQNIDEIIYNMQSLLGKESTKSGKNLIYASDLNEKNSKSYKISKSLVDVWNNMVSQKDEILIEILKEGVETNIGLTPTEDDIFNFLHDYKDEILILQKENKPFVNTNIMTGRVYILDKQGAKAKGRFSDSSNNSFTILKGSRIKETIAPRFFFNNNKNFHLRNKLLKDGIIKDNIFQQDYTFTSTSQAASVILGYSESGPRAFEIN